MGFIIDVEAAVVYLLTVVKFGFLVYMLMAAEVLGASSRGGGRKRRCPGGRRRQVGRVEGGTQTQPKCARFACRKGADSGGRRR